MLESSWARQAYHKQGEESPNITQDPYGEQMTGFTNHEAPIKGKLTFGEKPTLPQRLARLFGAIEVEPLPKTDQHAEARERKFTDWLQKAIGEKKSIEWIEGLFIYKSTNLKQLKDGLLFLSENVLIKGETGYDEVMKSYVETINKIEALIKQRKTIASESETLKQEIIKEITSLPKENGLRRKVVELSGVF